MSSRVDRGFLLAVFTQNGEDHGLREAPLQQEARSPGAGTSVVRQLRKATLQRNARECGLIGKRRGKGGVCERFGHTFGRQRGAHAFAAVATTCSALGAATCEALIVEVARFVQSADGGRDDLGPDTAGSKAGATPV